ncbi:unnamed protein product, partial [Owenia fusiformis]
MRTWLQVICITNCRIANHLLTNGGHNLMEDLIVCRLKYQTTVACLSHLSSKIASFWAQCYQDMCRSSFCHLSHASVSSLSSDSLSGTHPKLYRGDQHVAANLGCREGKHQWH